MRHILSYFSEVATLTQADCYPCGLSKVLQRTVLGVADPVAEPRKTFSPLKQHVRLLFGLVLEEVSLS